MAAKHPGAPPDMTATFRRAVEGAAERMQHRHAFMGFQETFATPADCLKHLEGVRWKNGKFCAKCGSTEQINRLTAGHRHQCRACRGTFRIIANSFLANTPIRLLPQWYQFIWLEMNGDYSIWEILQHVDVTRRTARYMKDRLAEATAADPADVLLAGIKTTITEMAVGDHPEIEPE